MEIEEIRNLAEKFRGAILRVPPHRLATTMQKFPRGACGDTSLLFGALLSDLGEPDFAYVGASRGSVHDQTWTTHAWIKRDALIVDLTADQFPDAPAGIIVTTNSDWHRSFEIDRDGPADFRKWRGAETLGRTYKLVREAMHPT